ncbi:MAG: beta-lactamase [uncultured bacterium]|nr:MAG: beta-lactamase [uncultured bacterium]
MTDFQSIDQLVGEAIKNNVFPGASLLVGYQGRIVFENIYGDAQSTPVKRPLEKTHFFDIASLTKPLATATLFILAVQEKLIGTKDLVSQFFSSGTLQGTTLENLLNHTSGLPDWKPYFKNINQPYPEQIIQQVLQEPLINPVGSTCIYSDLGYILLGDILEKIYSTKLDVLFSQKIAAPLGLSDTFYQPLHQKIITDESRFVATENCPWRHKILVGEVMDDNAWAMGGVAGHAGLFSTAGDLYKWIMELRRAQVGKSSLIQRNIFDAFTEVKKDRDLNLRCFTLGFDTPSLPSSSGHHFSVQSLGHLGYSGTSFWWDRDKDLAVILLTNRVHPDRHNEGIKKFRPQFHDAIIKALGLTTD